MLWDSIEADFQRDYGIDLTGDALDTMSWRKFKVLLDNLSPQGAVAARYEDAKKLAVEEDDDYDSNKQAAQDFFSNIVSYMK